MIPIKDKYFLPCFQPVLTSEEKAKVSVMS